MSGHDDHDDGVAETMAELFGPSPSDDPRDAPTEPNIDLGALFGPEPGPASSLRHPAADELRSSPGGGTTADTGPATPVEVAAGAPAPADTPPRADDQAAARRATAAVAAGSVAGADVAARADRTPDDEHPADATPEDEHPADRTPDDDHLADRGAVGRPAFVHHHASTVDDPVDDPEAEDLGSPLHALRRDPAGGRTSSWWRIGYPIVIALLVVAVPVLVLMGKDAILDSTGGNLVERVEDPALPGYEALTEPTPTLLVVHERADGSLGSASVLSLTGPTAGGVVVLPPDLVVDVDGQQGQALAQAYQAGGVDGVRSLVEVELHAAMDEVRLVDDAGWATLTGPLGGVTVDNPDEVVLVAADGTTATLPRGELALAPEQVGPYLAAANPGESDVNRMLRIQRLWTGWLQGVAAAEDQAAVIPGELDSGLGRFARALGVAQVEIVTLPVQQLPLPGSDAVIFVGVDDEVARLVARLVPFPVGSPPGSRLRVRLLDGTGRLDTGLAGVRGVVSQGGEVPAVGNAASFDVATTQLIYVDEARRAEVERLRDALGVGEVVKSEEVGDAVDVTVILGADAEAALADGTFGTALPATTTSVVDVPAAASTPADTAADAGAGTDPVGGDGG